MRILVVEDEHLALDDLLAMLHPLTDAHHVEGCASAAEALAHAALNPPDLLLTDIRMPEMDGLELVQRLQAHNGQLAAIVLSGYSEFEYARKSVHLGVGEYLLKPVRTTVLLQAVERALRKLADERARANQLRETHLLRRLLDVGEAARSEPDPLAGAWGFIITICENWESSTRWQDTRVDRAFIEQALIWAEPHPCDVVDLDAHCRVVLVPLAGAPPHTLDTLAQRLHRAIIDAGVMVHTTYAYKNDDARPQHVVREALAHLAHAMRFAAFTFVPPHAPAEDTRTGGWWKHFHLMAGGGVDKLPVAVGDLYAVLRQLQQIGATQYTIVQALDDVFGGFRQHTRSMVPCPLPTHEEIAAVVRRTRSYDELTRWIDSYFRPLLAHQTGGATPRQLVRALVALVHTAYDQDISLQGFTAEHNVSLAYFSRLFKDEVGTTFIEYLTNVRIENAKELLTRRDLRLSDISILVGYDDPKYFSQIFRKVVGVSPSDYQRSYQAQGHN